MKEAKVGKIDQGVAENWRDRLENVAAEEFEIARGLVEFLLS